MAELPPDYFTTPLQSRVYDYWLGGKDNFDVDRRAADEMTQGCPGLRVMARENRAFVLDAVAWLGRNRGIGQFLDLGCGLPSRPAVHDAARDVIPGAAVAYVDADPLVISHVRALQAGPGLAALEADVRDAEKVLGGRGGAGGHRPHPARGRDPGRHPVRHERGRRQAYRGRVHGRAGTGQRGGHLLRLLRRRGARGEARGNVPGRGLAEPLAARTSPRSSPPPGWSRSGARSPMSAAGRSCRQGTGGRRGCSAASGSRASLADSSLLTGRPAAAVPRRPQRLRASY